MIVPDPPEGELIRGGPRCGTCGWPIEKVIFAGHFGEFTAPLCTNRNYPIEVRPARPRRKKAIRRRSTVGKPRGDAKCPVCGKGGFAGVRGVEVHAGRAHKGQITTRADLLKPRGERAQ